MFESVFDSLIGLFQSSPITTSVITIFLMFVLVKLCQFARVQYAIHQKYKKLPRFPYFKFVGYLLGNVDLYFHYFFPMRKAKGLWNIFFEDYLRKLIF